MPAISAANPAAASTRTEPNHGSRGASQRRAVNASGQRTAPLQLDAIDLMLAQ